MDTRTRSKLNSKNIFNPQCIFTFNTASVKIPVCTWEAWVSQLQYRGDLFIASSSVNALSSSQYTYERIQRTPT